MSLAETQSAKLLDHGKRGQLALLWHPLKQLIVQFESESE